MFEDESSDLLQRKRRWLIALIGFGLLLAACILIGLGATVWRMQQTMDLVDSATVSDTAFEQMVERAILWGKLGLAIGTVAFAGYLVSFIMHQHAKEKLKTWREAQRDARNL